MLDQLGIGMTYAYSPQAKDRVERLFKTLQDRLVKKMRLKGIKSIEAANNFCKKSLSPNSIKDAPKLQKMTLICIPASRVLTSILSFAFKNNVS